MGKNDYLHQLAEVMANARTYARHRAENGVRRESLAQEA